MTAIVGALTLAACGGGSSGSESATSEAGEPMPTPAPTDEAFSAVDDEAQAEPAPEPAVGDAGETDPEPDAAAETDVAAQTETAAEPAVEDAGEAVPEPADVAEIGGRAFAGDVQAASDIDSNPFPDLVVDDVGRGGVANIRNIIPAARPILLWTWAPH